MEKKAMTKRHRSGGETGTAKGKGGGEREEVKDGEKEGRTEEPPRFRAKVGVGDGYKPGVAHERRYFGTVDSGRGDQFKRSRVNLIWMGQKAKNVHVELGESLGYLDGQPIAVDCACRSRPNTA